MGSTLPSNLTDFRDEKPPKGPRPALGGILVTIVLAVVLVGIIFVAVTRLTSGGLARPSATSPSTSSASSSSAVATQVASGVPADAATQQAIQQVIQQVDQAQVQAIQTNDPNVMASTATPEFYQEQVLNNQDLVDNGVTDIKLVNLEWGQITVNGNTAVATVYETWSTTFSDGTTQQARDRNIYTLVLDSGTWKVQADDHPDEAATPTQQPGVPAAP